jgi:hypothetical protein
MASLKQIFLQMSFPYIEIKVYLRIRNSLAILLSSSTLTMQHNTNHWMKTWVAMQNKKVLVSAYQIFNRRHSVSHRCNFMAKIHL